MTGMNLVVLFANKVAVELTIVLAAIFLSIPFAVNQLQVLKGLGVLCGV